MNSAPAGAPKSSPLPALAESAIGAGPLGDPGGGKAPRNGRAEDSPANASHPFSPPAAETNGSGNGAARRQRRCNTRMPDRWEDYAEVGRPIGETRLIAFKCPLRPDFFEGRPQLQRFEVQHLMDQLDGQGVQLGLVVDLTATTRYYDPAEFERRGVRYVKHACPGRDLQGLVELGPGFMRLVEQFFHDNPHNGKMVGVHCLHGLNRTGYLVCRYMHERLKWPVDLAIQHFNAARGHPMERMEYIEALRNPPSFSPKKEKPTGQDERKKQPNNVH